MSNSININSNNLPIREYNGQRVVTFKEIDTVHGRPEGTASRNFRGNRNRFIEGIDYFKIQPDEIRRVGITSPNGGIVLTESGYLMLAKSFNDDLAWTVQRELVNNYFRGKTPEPEQLTLETDEYHYFPKTYRGKRVIFIEDFAHFAKLKHAQVYHCLKYRCNKGEDYIHITQETIGAFRAENPKINASIQNIIIITASGLHKLFSYFNPSNNVPILEDNSESPAITAAPLSSNADEYVITLGVLGAIRENLKNANNKDGEEAINKAICFTSLELSKRL